eukprot:2987508-Heterocapsa_arctica.AAC.1
MCLGVPVSSLATVLACPARVSSLSSFALTFPEHGWAEGGEEQTHKQPQSQGLGQIGAQIAKSPTRPTFVEALPTDGGLP